MADGIGITAAQADGALKAVRGLHGSETPETWYPQPKRAAVAKEEWELPIRIPAERAVDIFAALTRAEKMDVLRFVMQARVDAMLAPVKEGGQ